ncbi:MAG: hypothetical protein B1H04_01590 [Planctomycetales bacterium 4484_123]|nr:MAG: hypothetical protein B1H04_01590 [Planctomycetales bacterium 4484_123]
MIVVAQDHWYEKYGKAGEDELIPLAASMHTGSRIVDDLSGRKDLVDPRRIVVLGHVYGAEIAPFLAGLDDRIAGCVTSCSSDEVITNDMHYWSGPCWMGSSRGLGCIKRYQPCMFIGTRRYDIGQAAGEHGVVTPKLPFLSQECRALAAPRPLLSIQEDPHLADAVRPAYELYRKGRNIAAIAHKWKTNLPVNVQEYVLELLLERLCGVRPGQAPKAVVAEIGAGLESARPSSRHYRSTRKSKVGAPAAEPQPRGYFLISTRRLPQPFLPMMKSGTVTRPCSSAVTSPSAIFFGLTGSEQSQFSQWTFSPGLGLKRRARRGVTSAVAVSVFNGQRRWSVRRMVMARRLGVSTMSSSALLGSKFWLRVDQAKWAFQQPRG